MGDGPPPRTSSYSAWAAASSAPARLARLASRCGDRLLALEQLGLECLERVEHAAVGALVGVGVEARLVGDELLRRGLRRGDELELGLLETQVGAKPGSEVGG